MRKHPSASEKPEINLGSSTGTVIVGSEDVVYVQRFCENKKRKKVCLLKNIVVAFIIYKGITENNHSIEVTK
jgi:hypothetical protein